MFWLTFEISSVREPEDSRRHRSRGYHDGVGNTRGLRVRVLLPESFAACTWAPVAPSVSPLCGELSHTPDSLRRSVYA
jgi:hypothetical protein